MEEIIQYYTSSIQFPREKDKGFFIDGFTLGYQVAKSKGCYTDKHLIQKKRCIRQNT